MAWIGRYSLLLIAGLALAAPPAEAGYNFPVWGGSGDAAYADRCPPNQYLVGVKSKTGAWFDALAIVCAPVQQGVVFDPKTYGQMSGGNGGGAPLDYICNNDEVITGIAPAFMHDGDKLKQLADLIITCTSKRSGTSKKLRIIGNHLSDEVFTQYPGHQFCGDQQVAVGFNLRYGVHVNAIGLMCDTYVPPPAVVAQAPPPKPIKTTGKAKGGSGSGASAPPGLLVCHTGGSMKPFGTPSGSGAMLLTFEAAPQAADVALPGPGQCAWDIVPVSASQPKRVGLNAGMIAQIGGIQSDTIFKVHASTMSAFLFATGDVEVVSGGGSLAAAKDAVGDPGQGGGAGEPAAGVDDGGMAGGMGVPSGDCPAGTAMVKTPAGLDLLNVREGPSSGATVVAQVPNGSEVTVSGGCFKTAAGLTQQKVKIPVGGWCRIEAPDQGCVSAQFLVFAGQGGGGDVPIDPGKGAGLAKQTLAPKSVGKGGGSFSGQWNVTDDNNVAYSMNLVQAGSGVTGQFKGADGSRGTLVGKVSGNTLRFAWVQTNDGQKGSGKFVLAGDGGSFSGSYNFQVGNFDAVEGSWNGMRK